MAYDPIKAHEYYEKYVKKGLRKGRKKGSSDSKKKGKKKGSAKKAAKSSLVGVSSSGLNNAGKIEAAFVKEKITKEMNEALAKETTDEGKEKIRREYSLKAQAEMDKLKKDPKYAQAKKEKAKKEGSSKSGSSKSGSSKSSGEVKSGSSTASKGVTSVRATQPKQSSGGRAVSVKSNTSSNTIQDVEKERRDTEERQRLVSEVNSLTKDLKDKIGSMSAEQKKEAKKKLNDTIKKVRERIRVINKS